MRGVVVEVPEIVVEPRALLAGTDIQGCKRIHTGVAAVHWSVDLDDPIDDAKRAAESLMGSGFRIISARQDSENVRIAFARCLEQRLESICIGVPLDQTTGYLLSQPRGLLLAIFGPDGAGKSSVSSAAVAALSPLFDHSRTLCWRPQLIASRIAKQPHRFGLPHMASQHGFAKSMLKISAAYLDFLLDHATLTRNQLRGCTLIAWDRYFPDMRVDKRRYRYCGPSWYSRRLLQALPVPDHFLGIVLDADEELMLARKRELPLHELRRQRAAYRELATVLPATYVVNNDGEFTACMERVLSLCIDRMAGWFEPIAAEVFRVEPRS